ncbi:MAG: serine O-acetyltransferase EpsC [Thermoplasmata archaeon]
MKKEELDRFEESVRKEIERMSGDIYKGVGYEEHHDIPKPSLENVKDIISSGRQILFPGYYSEWEKKDKMIDDLRFNYILFSKKLRSEVATSLGFSNDGEPGDTDENHEKAVDIVSEIVRCMGEVRDKLLEDVKAIYEFDPAAHSIDEVILSYPAVKALMNYRLAHLLYEKGVPILPRIITELAHSETGIDIHPGAEIGERFFIDHGTGVVVGETCKIGDDVKIYQGVTLGAKTTPLDDEGKPVKGVLRHPIIEDNVTIYAHATVLGRVTIGENSIIGSNVSVLEDVPQNSKLTQERGL